MSGSSTNASIKATSSQKQNQAFSLAALRVNDATGDGTLPSFAELIKSDLPSTRSKLPGRMDDRESNQTTPPTTRAQPQTAIAQTQTKSRGVTENYSSPNDKTSNKTTNDKEPAHQHVNKKDTEWQEDSGAKNTSSTTKDTTDESTSTDKSKDANASGVPIQTDTANAETSTPTDIGNIEQILAALVAASNTPYDTYGTQLSGESKTDLEITDSGASETIDTTLSSQAVPAAATDPWMLSGGNGITAKETAAGVVNGEQNSSATEPTSETIAPTAFVALPETEATAPDLYNVDRRPDESTSPALQQAIPLEIQTMENKKEGESTSTIIGDRQTPINSPIADAVSRTNQQTPANDREQRQGGYF